MEISANANTPTAMETLTLRTMTETETDSGTNTETSGAASTRRKGTHSHRRQRLLQTRRISVTAILLSLIVTLSTVASFQAQVMANTYPSSDSYSRYTRKNEAASSDQSCRYTRKNDPARSTRLSMSSTTSVLPAALTATALCDTSLSTSSRSASTSASTLENPNTRSGGGGGGGFRSLLFHAKSRAGTASTSTSSKASSFKEKTVSKTTKEQDADYQRRKEAWAAIYTSLDGLRSTFGSNRNLVWGDLDAATARRLYKTLLPKALLELYNTGVDVHPADLAPLAYQARVAAKLYARERCALPARVAANLYDGFRQWRKYGSFDTAGMSYQQVWNKYAATVLQDDLEHTSADTTTTTSTTGTSTTASATTNNNAYSDSDLDRSDVTAKICLKILERSCETNQMIDKWVLSSKNGNNAIGSNIDSDSNDSENQKSAFNHRQRSAIAQRRDLQEVTDKLEHDVRQLLLLSTSTTTTPPQTTSTTTSTTDTTTADTGKSTSSLSVQRIRLLRIIARSKRRIEAIQQLTMAQGDDNSNSKDKHRQQQHLKLQHNHHNKHHEQQQQHVEHKDIMDHNSNKLPWKDRPRKTTNRRKQWVERDSPTSQRRP